jgi:hypothetical protein
MKEHYKSAINFERITSIWFQELMKWQEEKYKIDSILAKSMKVYFNKIKTLRSAVLPQRA